MLRADHLNIDGPPFPVKRVRKFRSALDGEVMIDVGVCAPHTRTYNDVTAPPRVDPNFLTHFTAKGGPSIFEWSTLSM